MRRLLVALPVIGIGFVLIWGLTRARHDAPIAARGGEATSEMDAAIGQLRNELELTPVPNRRSDADRLADASAWVAANRPVGWPYAQIEARILADFEARARAEPRSIAWALDNARQELEMIRALDADMDGRVSDQEIDAFAEFSLDILDPESHPYLLGLLDGDGDGQIDDEFRFRLTAVDAQQAGLLERAQADLWDTDGDGFLSESERISGAAAARAHQVPFEDGHVEYTDTPPADPEAAQEAVLEKIAEQFGDRSAELARSKLDVAANHQLARSLNELMALVERDRGRGTEPSPPMPEWASFNTDGNPEWSEQETAALEAARAEWQQAFTEYQARGAARRMAGEFERLAATGDTDGDGLLLGGEWDDLIASRLADRENRLLLRSYDADGSGVIDAGELENFVGWYRAGSIRADMNYDGRVDAYDLRAMLVHFQQQD